MFITDLQSTAFCFAIEKHFLEGYVKKSWHGSTNGIQKRCFDLKLALQAKHDLR